MENPEALAGSCVESAHVALVVAHAFRGHAFAESRADDYGVLGHNGSGLDADLASFQIGENILVILEFEIN